MWKTWNLPLLYNPALSSSKARKEKAIKALEDRRIKSDRLNHRSNQMSGGQQQRVAIARRHRKRSGHLAGRRSDRKFGQQDFLRDI